MTVDYVEYFRLSEVGQPFSVIDVLASFLNGSEGYVALPSTLLLLQTIVLCYLH